MDNQIQPDFQPNLALERLAVQTSVSRSKKLFIIVLLVMLGLIVIMGLIYLGVEIGKSQITNWKSTIVQPTVSPTRLVINPTATTISPSLSTNPIASTYTVNPTVNSRANWKTYTDEEGKFSVKYPSEYVVKVVMNVGSVINRRIVITQYNESFESCRGDCLIIQSKIELILPDGSKAIKYVGHQGSAGGNIPETFIAYEIYSPQAINKYITIRLWELPVDIDYDNKLKLYHNDRSNESIDRNDEQLFDQIVSTFKFLE